MKGKNILLSALLIAVAVLAGCSEGVVYPAVPSSVVVKQTGDFVAGQDFDASKFQVVVTYFNGTTSTLKDVAVNLLEDGTANGVTVGDKVYVNVGYDINDNPVEYTGAISRIYTVSNVQVTTEASFPIDAETGKATVDPSLFTVTAYGSNDTPIVIGPSNYSVEVEADTDAAGYDEAEEVEATATVTFSSNIATANGMTSATATVTATKEASPVASMDILDVTGFSVQQTYKFPAFNYEELPAIEDLYSEVVLLATLDDGSANGLKDQKKLASDVEGIELYYADADKGVAFDPAYNSTNFVGGATNPESFNSGIAIKATWNGEPVEGQYTVPVAKTEIVLQYGGADLIAGTAVNDVMLSAADFRAFLKLDDKYAGELELTDEMLAVTTPATGNLTEGDDAATVTLSYMGLTATTTVDVAEAIPVTLKSVEATLEDYAAPAKQYYNTLPTSIDKNAIKVVATYSNGDTEVVSSDRFTATYYYDMETPLADVEKINNEYDLASVDHIYILVAYGETEEGVAFVEVPLAEPVATGAYLAAEYEGALGSEINWYIYLVNNEGRIPGNITSGYKVWSGTASATLPTTVTDEEQGPYFATYEGFTTANEITIPVGKSYVTILGEHFVVNLSEDVIPLYGSVIPTTDLSTNYVIDSESYDATGSSTPEIIAVKTEIPGQTIEESNTVQVTVQYVNKEGDTVTDTTEVTFAGIPYVTTSGIDSGDLTYTVDGETTALDLVANQSYAVSNIGIAESAYEGFGGAKPTVTQVKIDGGADTYAPGQSFTPASTGVTYTVTISYVDNTGETTTTTVGIAAR